MHLQGLDQEILVVPATRTGQGHLDRSPLGRSRPLPNLRIVRERVSHTQSRSSTNFDRRPHEGYLGYTMLVWPNEIRRVISVWNSAARTGWRGFRTRRGNR